MTCFDCGKRKNKGIPVIKLVDGTVRRVCVKCWLRNYKDPWMPRTAEKYRV